MIFPPQIDDGYLQFRFNLGSGETVARQITVPVNDGNTHHITVDRNGRNIEVVIDDSYVARATSPGVSDTLDIARDAIYLGAHVDDEGIVSRGFSGCIIGAKLNYKDLPVDQSSKHFVVNPSRGVELGCKTDKPPTGGAFPALIRVTVGSGGFIIIILLLSITVCIVGIYIHHRRKRRRLNLRRTRSSSPHFNWQPMIMALRSRDDQSPQPQESDDVALHGIHNGQLGGGLHDRSTPETVEQAFRTPDQTPEQPTHHHHQQLYRDHSLQQEHESTSATNNPPQQTESQIQVFPTRKPKDNAIPVEPPVVPQEEQHKKSSDAQDHPPLRHNRSLSGHQSIMTIMTSITEKSEPASVFDDSEVGRYILKRIEAANIDLESEDRDETILFKEEGELETLGSVTSLYDILREADENYEPVEDIATKKSRPTIKPKPVLSNIPNSHLKTNQEPTPGNFQNREFHKKQPQQISNHTESKSTPQSYEKPKRARGKKKSRGRQALAVAATPHDSTFV